MLTEAEFAEATEFPIHSERVRRLIAHDRSQRAEIERLTQIEGELETERLLGRWSSIETMRLDISEGKLDALFKGPFANILSELLVSWFVRGTEGVNYVCWKIEHEATGPLEFTCQRVDGKTPSERLNELQAEIERLRARADRYLAAMTAYVDARIADGICIAQDGEPVPVAFERTELAIRAIRAIVEESRRG